MRMVCPACSAVYEVPDSLLTPGRAVRCARCTHEWVPASTQPLPPPAEVLPPPLPAAPTIEWPDAEVIEAVEVETPAAAVPETPRFTAMDRLALHRANLDSNPLPLRVAWAASIVALLLLAVAVWVWRAELMHVWPASQRLFGSAGALQMASGKP